MAQDNNWEAVVGRLDAIQAVQARQMQILTTLESRVEQIREAVSRSAETATRLKLMADNAKKVAVAQGEALAALEKRLTPKA